MMRAMIMAALLCSCAFAWGAETLNTRYQHEPTYEITTINDQWLDKSRGRSFPVRIYCPVGSGPFPVIIFSHGLGGSCEHYAFLGQYWASCGYVSVHIQHPGSDSNVWKNKGPMKAWSDLKAAANAVSALNRVFDVRFSIDKLEELNISDVKLKGKLDMSRLGLSGHSFGAHTTLACVTKGMLPNISLTDSRIKAVVPMSTPVTEKTDEQKRRAFSGITIPCMHMTGTKDDSPVGETFAAARRVPFDFADKSQQYLINFQGGDHMVFTGRLPLIFNRGRDKKIQRYIQEYSLAFWDGWLCDDVKGRNWLENNGVQELGKYATFEMKSPSLD